MKVDEGKFIGAGLALKMYEEHWIKFIGAGLVLLKGKIKIIEAIDGSQAIHR